MKMMPKQKQIWADKNEEERARLVCQSSKFLRAHENSLGWSTGGGGGGGGWGGINEKPVLCDFFSSCICSFVPGQRINPSLR